MEEALASAFRLLPRLLGFEGGGKMHTRLGRWCHVTAPAYAKTCDWRTKVDMANADNGGGATKRSVSDDSADEHRAKLFLLGSFYTL